MRGDPVGPRVRRALLERYRDSSVKPDARALRERLKHQRAAYALVRLMEAFSRLLALEPRVTKWRGKHPWSMNEGRSR